MIRELGALVKIMERIDINLVKIEEAIRDTAKRGRTDEDFE